MAPLRILISGAGISGTALAYWLSKINHSVTVVEIFPSLRATGLQVDLRGIGVTVLQRMGLEAAFREHTVPEEGTAVVDSNNKRWAFFPTNKSGKGAQSFTTDAEIMRGDFCRLMHDASAENVKYVFGTSIERLEQTESGVNVMFSGGQTDRFDLVIGADGVNSRTRRMMLGIPEGEEDHTYNTLGPIVAYFSIPWDYKETDGYAATFYLAPGRRYLMTRRNKVQLQVYAGFTEAKAVERLRAARKKGMQAEKEIYNEVFKDAGWHSQEIMKRMMQTDDFYCEHLAVVKMEQWYKGSLTLVGDAAYCPSANTGMGTTSALVGAYILAGEIATHCAELDPRKGLEKALERYDAVFRPHMDEVQKGLLEQRNDGGFMPSSPFMIAILLRVVGLVSWLRFDILARYFLREKVTNWKLPNYSEVLHHERKEGEE